MGIDIVKHLHAKGWKVAIVGRKQAAGEAVVREIGDEQNARFFQCHLDDYGSQAAMFLGVWKAWGRLDLLCANAGIVDRSSLYIYSWRDKPVEEVPPEPDLQCTDIDYKAVIYGVQLSTHFMRHNTTPGGKIVVNASIGGIFPHQSYPEYCGAKAAVIQYVRGVAPLLKAKENNFINVVMPGAVETPIVPPEMIAAVSPEWYVLPQTSCQRLRWLTSVVSRLSALSSLPMTGSSTMKRVSLVWRWKVHRTG